MSFDESSIDRTSPPSTSVTASFSATSESDAESLDVTGAGGAAGGGLAASTTLRVPLEQRVEQFTGMLQSLQQRLESVERDARADSVLETSYARSDRDETSDVLLTRLALLEERLQATEEKLSAQRAVNQQLEQLLLHRQQVHARLDDFAAELDRAARQKFEFESAVVEGERLKTESDALWREQILDRLVRTEARVDRHGDVLDEHEQGFVSLRSDLAEFVRTAVTRTLSPPVRARTPSSERDLSSSLVRGDGSAGSATPPRPIVREAAQALHAIEATPHKPLAAVVDSPTMRVESARRLQSVSVLRDDIASLRNRMHGVMRTLDPSTPLHAGARRSPQAAHRSSPVQRSPDDFEEDLFLANCK